MTLQQFANATHNVQKTLIPFPGVFVVKKERQQDIRSLQPELFFI